MADFVVADHHFAHHNILSYCGRPWPNTDKMDADLVKLHNSVVTANDTTYFLGDVTMRGADRRDWLRKIITRMWGTKILVFGNHDQMHWEHYLYCGFKSCHTHIEYRQNAPTPGRGTLLSHPVMMCHDPAWAQDTRKLWVCGHLHNNAFCVGSHIAIVSVELTEYKPVLLNNIIDGLRPSIPK